jgi:hypothetical protein
VEQEASKEKIPGSELSEFFEQTQDHELIEMTKCYDIVANPLFPRSIAMI